MLTWRVFAETVTNVHAEITCIMVSCWECKLKSPHPHVTMNGVTEILRIYFWHSAIVRFLHFQCYIKSNDKVHNYNISSYSIKLLLIVNICLGLITAWSSIWYVVRFKCLQNHSLWLLYHLLWFDHITDYCHVEWLLLLELTK